MDQDWGAVRDALPRVRGRAPCRFFAAGTCRNGADCRFSHDQQVGAAQVARNGGPKQPCRFFARGVCQKGDSCSFAHDLDARQTQWASMNHDDVEVLDDDRKDDFIRPISGGIVSFEDGAVFSKISLDADFSSVRLTNLPRGSTPESVVALLTQAGIDTPHDSILVFTRVDKETNTCTAQVRAEDPKFEKAVRSKHLTAIHGAIEAIQFDTSLSNTSYASGGPARHSTAKKVHVSWYRPTKSVWLKFTKESVAQVAKTFFDSGEYKIMGQEVTASGATGSRDRDRTIWTVQLTSLPAEVTENLVQVCFEPDLRPERIVMSEPSYIADDTATRATVKGLLAEFGSLEWWATNAGKGGKRLRAVACFTSESDARDAVEALNGFEAPFSNHIKLALDLAHSTKFKFLARIYDVVAPEIEAFETAWKTQGHIEVYEYPVEGRFKSMKIEGRQSEEVARAATELEAILTGVIAADENGTLWSPALAHSGELLQKVKDIEKQANVSILRDTKKCLLKVVGPELNRIQAVGLIADALKEDTSSLFSIELTADQYAWAQRGGFMAVSTALGRNVAKFDSMAEPKRILIVGSKQDHEKAVEIVSAGKDHDLASSDVDVCSVCWCDADDPVAIACGHQYCAGCFESLAHFYASSASAIQCKGGSDTCRGAITLDDLQKNLSPTAFEAVLEQSFGSYVDTHPLEFRHCTTPGCLQIYRVAPTGEHICTQCRAVTCKASNEAHAGKTCGEHGDFNSEEQQQLRKTKRELGIKDCAKCGTAIEKTYGCNHVTCRCGAHICWCCLETFTDSKGCYDHLHQKHGGIYADGDGGGVWGAL